MTLSEDILVSAAIEIMLRIDRSVTIQAGVNGFSLRLPTTRQLADHLGIPHYYVLPYFATMEKDGLIQRKERVGISTTPKGTRLILERMEASFYHDAVSVLGEGLYGILTRTLHPTDQPDPAS